MATPRALFGRDGSDARPCGHDHGHEQPREGPEDQGHEIEREGVGACPVPAEKGPRDDSRCGPDDRIHPFSVRHGRANLAGLHNPAGGLETFFTVHLIESRREWPRSA